MGFRAYLRDALVFILFYETLLLFIKKSPPTLKFFIMVLTILIITMWFMLERLGILPKVS